MRSLSHAERLLALFTSPACAEAIAGDLAEARGRHGRVWFWRQVFATSLALCGNTMASAPAAVLRLVVVGGVLFAASTFAGLAGVGLFPGLFGPVVAWLVLSGLWWGCAFGAGASLVGMQPARGMAACTVIALAIEAALIASAAAGLRLEWLSVSTGAFATTAALAPLPLLLGSVSARRRALAFAGHTP
jgi:hypothetical protein